MVQETRTAKLKKKKADGAQSIHRAITILRIVAKYNNSGATLSKIARSVDLAPSTTHRMLKVLSEEGMVNYDAQSKCYNLGIGLYEIGSQAHQYKLREHYRSTLERISELCGGTAFLIARSGYDVICIDRVIGSTPIQILVFDVGSRHPLGVGAGSLAILASLPEDELDDVLRYNAQRYAEFKGYTSKDLRRMIRFYRKNGYIANSVTPHTIGVGVALYDDKNHLIGAMSVSGITSEMDIKRQNEIAALIQSEIG